MNHKNRLVILWTIVCLLISAGLTPTSAQGVGQATVTQNPLNLRSVPSVKASVLQPLEFQNRYPVLSQTVSGYWYELSVGDVHGWVCARFVELDVAIATIPKNNSVVDEDCAGVTKTNTSTATGNSAQEATAPAPQQDLADRYGTQLLYRGYDIDVQIIDKATGAVLFTTEAEYNTPNDVKAFGFCPDYIRFVAVYHYSDYSWAGVWEVPSGRLLYSKTMLGWWTYMYDWAC